MEMELFDRPFGVLLQECYERTLAAWRSEVAPSLTQEETLAYRFEGAELNVLIGPKKVATVSVTITGKRRSDTVTHVFQIRQVSPRAWILGGNSIPER